MHNKLPSLLFSTVSVVIHHTCLPSFFQVTSSYAYEVSVYRSLFPFFPSIGQNIERKFDATSKGNGGILLIAETFC